jgi:hypothetical protein
VKRKEHDTEDAHDNDTRIRRKIDNDAMLEGALAQRARLKEQLAMQPSSSLRDTEVTPPSGLFSKSSGGKISKDTVDPYLLKLLNAEDVSRMSKDLSTKDGLSKLAVSTEFKIPEPKLGLKPVKGHDIGSKSAAGIQASNSLEKKNPKWDYLDTQNVLGEDITESLRNSVIQNQKEYVEQLFDLHRAIAVQRLLVRHNNDQKAVVNAFKKEEARAKKAMQLIGKGFETSSLHKGLHPDSQFAAFSRDSGTDLISGEDLTGSGDDVAGSGSGGNGKSGNGSGGGSTSHLNPVNVAVAAGQVNGSGAHRAPSGASNAPRYAWPTTGQPPSGGQAGWGQEMGPAIIDFPSALGSVYGQPYPGADPMMWWYQDYYNRLANAAAPQQDQQQQDQQQQDQQQRQQQNHDNKPKTLPTVFKWWHDPKLTFGPPVDAKEVLGKNKAVNTSNTVSNANTRREGAEVQSAPQSEEGPASKPAEVKAARIVAPPPKKTRRHRRRLLEDPADEASSGTSGPAHHLDSSDGITARSPRTRDANVAKLLLSFSGKSHEGPDHPKKS